MLAARSTSTEKETMKKWIITILVVPFLTGTVAADEVPRVGWADLIPKTTADFEDPFAVLTEKQLGQLGIYLRVSRMQAETPTKVSDGMITEANEAAASLREQGVDIEGLLARLEEIKALRTKRASETVKSLNGAHISIPGYALPLAYEDEKITEFLLVPWVGACIQTPPPPPNQIIFVQAPEGMDYQGHFAPVLLTGRIEAKSGDYDLFLVDGSAKITAGYVLDMSRVQEYSAAESDALAKVEVPVSSPDHTWWQNMQMRVSAIFTTTMTNIRDRQSIKPFLVGLLIAFLYGAAHTLGPGHGKAVVLSYFVGEGGSLGRGVRFGTQIAVSHVLTAVVLAVLADLAVRQTTGSSPASFRIVRLLSYASIAAIGGFMLLGAIRDAFKHNHLRHEHGCSCHVHHAKQAGGLLSMAIGAVPCTGALMVLLYGLANDLLIKSVLMVFAISLGMAITLLAIGIAAILGRRIIEIRLQKNDTHQQRFLTGLSMAGATCVLLIGVSLFVHTL